ncbi:amylo-alpha-1,6-glucosidase [Povalibacter sp.]|uniref:amylo-alpha-1,6-glucosidase n=1 Tax=Povalibacter sp. TaxID=1962978 RepID=UPI002F41D726
MSIAEEPGEKPGLLPRLTLKESNSFLLADALGDIHGGSDGFFTNDTRLISQLSLAIAGRRPSLLGAAISQDNTLFTAHLSNRPLMAPGELAIPPGVIYVERERLLWQDRMYERIQLTNFGEHDVEVALALSFAADFADIFEVQGQVRKQRGTLLPPEVDSNCVSLAYNGRDGIVRRACIEFSLLPQALTHQQAQFVLAVPKGGLRRLFLEIGANRVGVISSERFRRAAQLAGDSMGQRLRQGATVTSPARLFNQWLDRSRSDLALLTTPLATGPYPYAGIPWFATQFGRDAIITALQTLWINPRLAAGVLNFLASTQAREESAFRDAQPGKIMHETRRGEMAALQEVPFGLYYGGVDTTPLFIMLAGAYEGHTGDRSVVDGIWQPLLNAMDWVERRMAQSPIGFLDYARGERTGLVNQSWKDSHDSMFHADGTFPAPPVAVAEVQGYAFAALRAMADLAGHRGMSDAQERWQNAAEGLRFAIEERFWIPGMNYYAIALDGQGDPCQVYASDAGHLLYCGVPNEERAAIVTAQLLSHRFCSGWGIRTLASDQPRFNPMSYHNGSVWPHDTSICAAGMARYGAHGSAADLLNQIFETAIHFNMRLPELYCGFPRVAGQGPVPYPVACLPQAWAAGAAFLLLQACLGLSVDGRSKTVHITRPALPPGIEVLHVTDLAVGDATIDLEFRKSGEEVLVVPTKHIQGEVHVLTGA